MQPLTDVSSRTILLMGDPRLRQVAAPVAAEELASPETQEFIDALVATMRSAGGAGLAVAALTGTLSADKSPIDFVLGRLSGRSGSGSGEPA